ncbi:MAG: GNAT family N-acetyltransferase [Euryarchaeota archaeon]|nr:GNAT family N-acetyltransferase [Euryarchaeota archaeon]MDE1837950.1 GNAT family N-acetyltransferase [Euryarchaeota archaeon]MDE2046641.1 GNAT family N-acetyltransferase [Thermoplasmata archaeon]
MPKAARGPRFEVRLARPNDRPRLEAWQRDLEEHLAAMLPDFASPRLPPSYGREYVAHSAKTVRKFGGFWLVAGLDGTPVGFLSAMVQPYPERITRMESLPSLQGYVLDAFVVPRARGQGVGGALFKEAERLLRKLGCDSVHLNVNARNVQARGFYRSTGFRELGLRLWKPIAVRPRDWPEAGRRRRRVPKGPLRAT